MPVHANPTGVPGVTWNCAALPAICQNLGEMVPLDANTKKIKASNDTNFREYVEFHYDQDRKCKIAEVPD